LRNGWFDCSLCPGNEGHWPSTIPLKLDADEEKGFQRSASILHDAIESLKL
jgi:hypothetical protein